MNKLTVSLAQIRIELGDVAANLRQAVTLVSQAVHQGADLIVLPELWSTGYALERAPELASIPGEGTFDDIAQLAQEYQIAIAGSILEKTESGVANCMFYYDKNGQLQGTYRKIHLFRLMDEDKWLESGDQLTALNLDYGKAGMAICYDLRFPELFRHYSVGEDARLIIIPAEWPLPRADHWRTLLVARAIENQCFVIGVNAAEEVADGTVFAGHSMVIDPWGKIVVEAGESAQLLTVSINLDLVDEVRGRIPVFEDRRTDIYG